MVRSNDTLETKWSSMNCHIAEELWVTGSSFCSIAFYEAEDIIFGGEENGGIRILCGSTRALVGFFKEHEESSLNKGIATASKDGHLIFWEKTDTSFESAYGRSEFSYAVNKKILAHEGGIQSAKLIQFNLHDIGPSVMLGEVTPETTILFVVTAGVNGDVFAYDPSNLEKPPHVVDKLGVRVEHIDTCGNLIAVITSDGNLYIYSVEVQNRGFTTQTLKSAKIQYCPNPVKHSVRSIGVHFFENNPTRLAFAVAKDDSILHVFIISVINGKILCYQTFGIGEKESSAEGEWKINYSGFYVIGSTVISIITMGSSPKTGNSKISFLNHDTEFIKSNTTNNVITSAGVRITPHNIGRKFLITGHQDGSTLSWTINKQISSRNFSGNLDAVTAVTAGRAGILTSSKDGSARIFRYYTPEEVSESYEANRLSIRKANELREKGNNEFKKGNWKDALKYYSESLTQDPENCAVLSNRALTYSKLGRFDEAIADCERGIEEGFTSGQGFGTVPYACIPFVSIQQAITCFPILSKLYNRKGDALAKKGKWEDALKCFEKSLCYLKEVNTDDIMEVLKMQNEYVQLKTAHDKAKLIIYLEGTKKKALEEMKKGNYKQSLETINSCIDTIPCRTSFMFYSMQFIRCQNFYKMNDYQSLLSEGTEVFENLADSLKKEDLNPTLIEKERKELKKCKTDLEKHLCSANIKLGKGEQAIKYLDNILGENPTDPEAIRLLIESRILSGAIVADKPSDKDKEVGLELNRRKQFRDASAAFDTAFKKATDPIETCHILNLKAAANYELRNLSICISETNKAIEILKGLDEEQTKSGRGLEVLVMAHALKCRAQFDNDLRDDAMDSFEFARKHADSLTGMEPSEHEALKGMIKYANDTSRRRLVEKLLLEVREEHSNGDRYMTMKMGKESIDSYAKAARHLHNEHFPEVEQEYEGKAKIYSNRASCLIGEERYEEAEQDLKKAISYDPRDPLIWEAKGHVDLNFDRFRDAMLAYMKCFELDPKLDVIYYMKIALTQTLSQIKPDQLKRPPQEKWVKTDAPSILQDSRVRELFNRMQESGGIMKMIQSETDMEVLYKVAKLLVIYGM